MPQLDPTWFPSQLFWLAVSFIGLYFVLARFVLPPLLSVLAERERAVASDLDLAQNMKDQAERAKSEYERMLTEARAKAQQLVDVAMQAHKAKAEESEKALDRDIAGKLAEAERSIAARKQELMEALTPAVSELAGLAVEKLTQRAPAGDRVTAAIHELLKSRGNRR